MGAARELAAQDGDFAAASLALQNDRCWGMYRTLMAYRAALEMAAAKSPSCATSTRAAPLTKCNRGIRSPRASAKSSEGR